MTSFYKRLERTSCESPDFDTFIRTVTRLFSEEYSCTALFCEIFGKRWSYLTGTGNLPAGAARRETFKAVSRQFGILIFPDPGDRFQWESAKPVLIHSFTLFLDQQK
ncbi:MAG TPA: hypothetical protein ENN72_00240 [Firmicutes bacterium]|nr:hypothetical protein [Bacillota bacterium]